MMFAQMVAVTAASSSIGKQDSGEAEPIIGWCAFYPGVDVGMEHVAESGADGMSVCSAGLYIEQEEGKFDFTTLDKQIEFAEKNGLRLALISEMNPFFAPKWMREKVREVGEAVKGYTETDDSRDGGIPSIQSPVFKEIQEEIIRKATEHIRERDTSRVISYYHPGAEWWFLPQYRYNPADIADFREWLARKYGTIESLNDAWVSKYSSFDEVAAPAADHVLRSKKEMQATVLIEEGGSDCAWSTTLAADTDQPSSPETIPGKVYTFSAQVKCEDLSAPGVTCWILWVDANTGAPIYGAGSVGASFYGTTDGTRVSVTGTATGGSGRAQLSIKVVGKGSVVIDDIRFVEEGSDENMAPSPADEGAWRFSQASEDGKAVGRLDDGSLSVVIPRSEAHKLTFGNANAAVGDWAEYWYETGAEYINYCCGLFKRLDPSRRTATYLTFAFSYPAEWDYSQWTAISPDEVAMRGTNIDEIGLQICAADGDPYRVIANLDLIRKYGKKMWATDLIDFTSGIDIGYPAMDKITQATVQHGAKGLIYCSWNIPSVRDYSFYPHMGLENLNKMLSDARASVKLVDGMSVKSDAAIVMPILPASPSDPEGFKNDFRSFMGWYKILESMRQTVDIVTLNEIVKGADLSRYKWLMLPDCAYIQEKALARIEEYADSGGLVISSGRLAQFDEIGRPLASSPCTKSMSDYGKSYAGELIRDTHAGNTPPLFLWREDAPETDQALASAQQSIRGLLSAAGIEPDIHVVTGNPGIRAVEYEGDGCKAVYLVNMAPDDANDVTIRMRGETSGVSVYADTKQVEAEALAVDGWVEVKLPAFKSSCIVRL